MLYKIVTAQEQILVGLGSLDVLMIPIIMDSENVAALMGYVP